MENKNLCIFAGTVTPSPKSQNGFELRYVRNGNALLKINLVVQDSYNTKDGQKQMKKTYIDIAMWGKKAEEIARQLTPNAFIEVMCSYDRQKGSNGKYYPQFTSNKITVLSQGFQQPVQGYPAQGGYQPTNAVYQPNSKLQPQVQYPVQQPNYQGAQQIPMQPPIQQISQPAPAFQRPNTTAPQVPVQQNLPPQMSDDDIPF